MGLNIKNPEVEQLAAEVADLAGETKTEAIRRALELRKTQLGLRGSASSRGRRLPSFLERRVWPTVSVSGTTMASARLGTRTSGAEVTNVSTNGIWLLIDEREIFLAFSNFPWFEDATIREISRVQRPSLHHLHWPDLDVDLSVESLENPDSYPLVSKVQPTKRSTRARGNKRRSRTVTRRASRQRD